MDYKLQNIDLANYIVFIDKHISSKLREYITLNLPNIKKGFKIKNKRFILLSDINQNLENFEAIKYYYPFINHFTANDGLILELSNSLDACFIFKSVNNQFIRIKTDNVDSFKESINKCLLKLEVEEIDYLPTNINDYNDSDIKLDAEVERKVQVALEQLEDLKDSGQFLKILPIIENYIVTNSKPLGELSVLKIDDDFNIFLEDYELEIKLSHLTKSIYFLFLNHIEGIKLNNLYQYKEELFGYYKAISNRADYIKMKESIDDLTNTKSNAIYVHLSRIKSAFINVIQPSIALSYYVDGAKLKAKKILLNRKLLHFKYLNSNDEIDF